MDRPFANRLLDEWLRDEPRLGELAQFLLRSFAEAAGIFIVGGALRDRLLDPPRPPKDVDVTLGGVERSRLLALDGAHANFFGGAMLPFHDLSVDLWPIEDTFHIQQFHLPPTIDGFLDGAPFNLDKIAYDLQSATLREVGCLAGIAAREIRYAPAHAYLEHIQALRCILLKWKTGFTLHSSATALLERVAETLRSDASARPEMKRYLSLLKQFYDDSVFDRVIEEIQTTTD
jgi:hypothetical protein